MKGVRQVRKTSVVGAEGPSEGEPTARSAQYIVIVIITIPF